MNRAIFDKILVSADEEDDGIEIELAPPFGLLLRSPLTVAAGQPTRLGFT